MNKTRNILEYYPIHRLLIQFAIPSVISMLVNALYNIVDQIFIGQGVGYLGNAATTVVLPLMTILVAIGTLIGSGASAYASIKLGEHHEKQAEDTLGCAFVLILIVGIIFTIAGLLFIDPILHLFGATSENFAYAKQYGSIIVVGSIFNLLGISLSNLARCDGSPKVAMYSMVAGAIINTILDPIYIFVFHWGVVGAAIATITSQIIGAIILLYYFFKKSHMRLHKDNLKLNLMIIKDILSLGISSGITQGAITIMQIILNNALVHYGNLSPIGGDVALSAMGVVNKMNMLMISICVGIGVGAQPILGYNKGAKQYERIRKTYYMAMICATSVSIIWWLLCQCIPEVILSLFGMDDPSFASFSIYCMRTFMFGCFCGGFQITATNYFQATGQPLKASILSMMRQLILLIPLIIILPKFMGLDGIIKAGPIADFGSMIIVFIFIFKEMRNLNQKIVSSKVDCLVEGC